MGAVGITIVVVVGLLIGLGVQYLTGPKARLDWLFVALATGIGAYVGSEWLTTTVFGQMADGPQIDGLVILPGIIVGLVLGVLADAFSRYVMFESVDTFEPL